MVSLDIKDYSTAHIAVKCKTGVYADLATGRHLIEKPLTLTVIEAGSGRTYEEPLEPYSPFEYDSNFALFNGSKSKYLNKKLLSPVYAVTYKADESSVGVCIWIANEVNKHGAIWKKHKEYIFLASAIESFSLENYDKELDECLALIRNNVAKNNILFPVSSFDVSEGAFKKFPRYKVLKSLLGVSFTPETVFDLIVTCRYMSFSSNRDKLKNLWYGVEIEFTGITRKDALNVIARHFNKSPVLGSVYDNSFREWTIKYDGSIRTTLSDGTPAGKDYSCELVTPICSYGDIPMIQEIVRELRHAGMVVNESCGIHVHVDGKEQTVASLKGLANLMAQNEDNLFSALMVDPRRSERYCKKIDKGFLSRINREKILSLNEMKDLWYNGDITQNLHYNSTRYHALNLHSLWQNKGIEFRMFNSTTHAGKVKAYIQLCLALCSYSLFIVDSANVLTPDTMDYKNFRSWLIMLGLSGEEFKTARIHLLSNLKEKARSDAA